MLICLVHVIDHVVLVPSEARFILWVGVEFLWLHKFQNIIPDYQNSTGSPACSTLFFSTPRLTHNGCEVADRHKLYPAPLRKFHDSGESRFPWYSLLPFSHWLQQQLDQLIFIPYNLSDYTPTLLLKWTYLLQKIA